MPELALPSVGRVVHYVSYGSPKGEYRSECRAAIITAVHEVNDCDLAVLNPTGMFFNQYVSYNPSVEAGIHVAGTWHWPERVPEGS